MSALQIIAEKVFNYPLDINVHIIEYLYGPTQLNINDIHLIFSYRIAKDVVKKLDQTNTIEDIKQILDKYMYRYYLFGNIILMKPPLEHGPRPSYNSLMENMFFCHSNDIYFDKIRNYVGHIFSQIDGLIYLDKKGDFKNKGFDLLYKDNIFSLVWQNPEWYMGKFAEILGQFSENDPTDNIRRLDLEDFPNILKILDKN